MPGLSPGLTRARVSGARGRAEQVSPARRQRTFPHPAAESGISDGPPSSLRDFPGFVLFAEHGRPNHRQIIFFPGPPLHRPSAMIFPSNAFISVTVPGIAAARFFVSPMSSAKLWSGTCKLGPRHGGCSRLGETAEGRAFFGARGRGPFHAAMMVRSTRRSGAGLVCFALNGGPPGERRLFECGAGVALLGHPIA